MAFTGLTGGTGPQLPTPTPDTFSAQLVLFAQDNQLQWTLNQMRGATPDQVRTFVANNVTDLASARQLLTLMLLWMTSRAQM